MASYIKAFIYLFLMHKPRNKMSIDAHIMFCLKIKIKIII